jgi:lysophospholipase L1-like esterase
LEGEVGVVRREFVFGDEVFEVGMVRDAAPRPGRVSARTLQDNLEELVRLARDRRLPLILMSYPAQLKRSFYVTASRVLERVAKESRTPFVDLRTEFSRRCSDPECREFLFPDQHPNAAGYRIVADGVFQTISQLLAE